MMHFTSRRLAVGLALLPLVWGCTDLGPGAGGLAEEVMAHRQIWAARRSAAYVFDLERQCFCALEALGPVRVTVEGNQVVARVYTDSGTAVPPPYADLFPTVDGLFDILQDALDRSAERVDVTWDPVSGAPAAFFIDYDPNLADEELGYRIVSAPTPAPTG